MIYCSKRAEHYTLSHEILYLSLKVNDDAFFPLFSVPLAGLSTCPTHIFVRCGNANVTVHLIFSPSNAICSRLCR